MKRNLIINVHDERSMKTVVNTTVQTSTERDALLNDFNRVEVEIADITLEIIIER